MTLTIMGLPLTDPFRVAAFMDDLPRLSVYVPLVRLRLVVAYYEIGEEEGVRPEVGLGQSAKETGYWSFGGDVTPGQWNFAGIGATGGVPGISWPTLEDGVRGHLRRLRMYADASAPYDLSVLRRPLPLRYWGIAPHVEDLGGRWAPSPTYGVSVRSYVDRLVG